MDPRTFHRNGPGLAECESEAAWRRLWGDRRADRYLDTRRPVSNVAATWPQFGYRRQTHSTMCASRAGKSLATELGFAGHIPLGWGDAMTAAPETPVEESQCRAYPKSIGDSPRRRLSGVITKCLKSGTAPASGRRRSTMVTEKVSLGRPGPATFPLSGGAHQPYHSPSIRPIIHTAPGNATRSCPNGPAVTASPSGPPPRTALVINSPPKDARSTLLSTRGGSNTLAAGPLDLDRKQFHAIAWK
jgi:hypothetical protein